MIDRSKPDDQREGTKRERPDCTFNSVQSGTDHGQGNASNALLQEENAQGGRLVTDYLG